MTRSPFARLRDLLRDVPAPAGVDPIPLHLGEARLVEPPLDVAALDAVDGWTRYPELGGSAELRTAYLGWLARRFGGSFGEPADAGLMTDAELAADAGLAVEPTPGSKQALAVVIAQAVRRARARGVTDPVVVLPNPGYPTYLAGTEAAGARPLCYPGPVDDGPADDGSGLADPVDALAAAVAAGAGRVAAVVVCHPGNPDGETLTAGQLARAAEVARRADAVLVVDECYVDLWLGTASAGFLSDPAALADPGLSFVVLHTLAKRSGAPGLRSGFVVGDRHTVAAYAEYNRTCGVSLPRPVCAVSAALWSDDTHVARARAALARNWDTADELLKDLPGYRRPGAGFFLWLPVPDDPGTTRRLWRDQALTVMPGRYLAVDTAAGSNPAAAGKDPGVDTAAGSNPGAGHLRVALVHDEARTEVALTRLRAGLT
ncbi:aminotransferase class I/II-fold pyridoxal phosphate-dependent enzyme [Micromonospora sp. WMMA1923]|uniref:aminotransferase class I/II-fold pyridoxal phosphate-dependent enzyme n=1 Tax=Micromonospora sp. WMMA1923 TaxID=3404125 RepID=UPI003B95F0D9